MPPARRKVIKETSLVGHPAQIRGPLVDKPHAPPVPETNNRYGGKPVIPRKTWEQMKNSKPVSPELNVMPRSKISLLDAWHHSVNQVSGTMVFGFKDGLTRDAAAAMIQQLRLTADSMEKELLG